MVYSVWQPLTKQYDYYETPASLADIKQPLPSHLQRNPPYQIGWDPESASWSLPSNAVKIGSGAMAQGMIARKSSSALGDWMSDSPTAVAVLIVAGFIAYKLLK